MLLMVKQTQSLALVSFSILLLFIFTEVEGAKRSYGVYNTNPVKLFVFGDSYADTGNTVHSEANGPPSGITYPGKPAGRFSDGRVLSDYIASFLNIETPIAYRLKNSSNIQNGINFAYGGTGVFTTHIDGPNMTAQIDSFEQLIQQKVFSKFDIESSVALLSASGNDYTTALRNGKLLHPDFIESLVNQLSENMKRVKSLGIYKVAVGLLPPIGCLPAVNVVSFRTECIGVLNEISKSHNNKLLEAVQDLNKESGNSSAFISLDLYDSFISTIDTLKEKHHENSTLMNPLDPCCNGLHLTDSCGDVDDKGNKKYSLCEKPELSFFWNSLHPSQNGWSLVYTLLKTSLGPLIGK